MDAAQLITQKFDSVTDWRGDLLRKLRSLILSVDPAIIEEWKWMGTAVWNCDGILFSLNPHSYGVRMTFLYGAKLPDPQGVFNSELEGNQRRAIKWEKDDGVNVQGLKDLIRAAIAYNRAKPAKRKPDAVSSVSGKKPGPSRDAPKMVRVAKKKAAPKATTKKAPAKRVAARKTP